MLLFLVWLLSLLPLLAVTAVLTAPVAVAVHLAAAHLTPLGVLGPLSAAGLGTCTILAGLALSPWAFDQDATIAHELRGAPGRLLARKRADSVSSCGSEGWTTILYAHGTQPASKHLSVSVELYKSPS